MSNTLPAKDSSDVKTIMRVAERIRNSKERRYHQRERERVMMPNPSEEKITAEFTNDDHYEVNVSEGG